MTGQVSKEKQVEAMFNGIAPRYDFLNHLLSLGIDKRWRAKLIKGLLKEKPQKVLDVATGTADLAIALAKKDHGVNVLGIDIAEVMLNVGREKVIKRGLEGRISFKKTSSESMPLQTNSFDAVMVAFGVRNFENPLAGLKEMFRVLKPKGTVNILEFTLPRNPLVRLFYLFYFKRVLPMVGRWLSGHKTAYTYLPESVEGFAEREEFLELMKEAGFENSKYKSQSFGIAAIYTAIKPIDPEN